jgi:ectoine hydroxylase-related dioxygenase (phytanoyl-CoA dioxygenase family)
VGTDVVGTGLPWIEAIAQAFAPHTFVGFHRHELPALVARHGGLVVADLRGVAPLAFRTDDGTTFTWRATGRGVEAVDGDAGGATVVELSERTFSEFLDELLTASGAVRTGRARLARGELAGWQRWEPAIQSLCSGREIYSASVWRTLIDRDGAPLDLHRRFRANDDVERMRQFLDAAGYLHIEAVFTDAEVERYRREVEDARSKTRPGDPFSWWSVNSGGREVVTRINYLGRHSQTLQDLSHDPRLSSFAQLASPEMRVCDDRLDGPMVFIKNANVVTGNGDLGWHVDDGIGGHPVMCPLVQAGVQLDHANAENGQLLVLAGSHRYTKHWVVWGEEADLPVVAFDTQPGDLTIHYGDTMHTTPPPTWNGAGRRALYYKFAEPNTFRWIPEGCHYNDALFRADALGRVATRATTWDGTETS